LILPYINERKNKFCRKKSSKYDPGPHLIVKITPLEFLRLFFVVKIERKKKK